MPEKNGFDPGQFCWIELGTTDADAAKAFYGGLFGWTAEESDAGDAGVYTMFGFSGRDVGGMYTRMKEQLEEGRVPGAVHASTGHEGAIVGACTVTSAQADIDFLTI